MGVLNAQKSNIFQRLENLFNSCNPRKLVQLNTINCNSPITTTLEIIENKIWMDDYILINTYCKRRIKLKTIYTKQQLEKIISYLLLLTDKNSLHQYNTYNYESP